MTLTAIILSFNFSPLLLLYRLFEINSRINWSIKGVIYCRKLTELVENKRDIHKIVEGQMFIDELKKGSQQAFRTLIEQYSQNVVSTCHSFVKNAADAEDIAQEVFLEVYKSVRSFRSDADLNTWLYRIAINKSLDFLRKQKRKKRIADLRGLFLFKKAQNHTDIGPHAQLEDAERNEILHQQVGLLPENQQIALVLSQYEQMSNAAVADVMGISVLAVESLLHRARANLRKNLEKYFEKNL